MRSNFVAAHYPATVARMYEWSPDEVRVAEVETVPRSFTLCGAQAIPELYTEPRIFRSLHRARGLDDLAVPAWCADERGVSVARVRLSQCL